MFNVALENFNNAATKVKQGRATGLDKLLVFEKSTKRTVKRLRFSAFPLQANMHIHYQTKFCNKVLDVG